MRRRNPIARNKPKRPKALWAQIREQREKPRSKRRKYIARQSEAGRKRDTLYNRELAKWKKEPLNAICAYPLCGNATDDNHHIFGRGVALTMDKRFWLPLCRAHHNMAQTEIGVFRALGLLAPHGFWRRPPLIDIVADKPSHEPILSERWPLYVILLREDLLCAMASQQRLWTTTQAMHRLDQHAGSAGHVRAIITSRTHEVIT